MSYSLPAPGPRLRALSRRLTLMLAAGAIALAGLSVTARPARADAEDLLRFLAGAVVIAAIINAVDDNHTPHYIDPWTLPDSCLETLRVDWRTFQVYNAHCLSRAGYHNLPNRCARDFRIGYSGHNGYVAECLWESGYRRGSGYYGDDWNDPRPGPHPGITPHPGRPPVVIADRLPSNCEVTYRMNGRRMEGYWGGCLRNAGLRDLPRQCRMTTTDGDAIYDARCLYDAGYRRGR